MYNNTGTIHPKAGCLPIKSLQLKASYKITQSKVWTDIDSVVALKDNLQSNVYAPWELSQVLKTLTFNSLHFLDLCTVGRAAIVHNLIKQ